jgi:hypothetical protein
MNLLHQAMQSGLNQSAAIAAGVPGGVQIGRLKNIPMILSDIDDKILMEFEGYLDDADAVGVVSTSALLQAPAENTHVIVPNGDTYLIRRRRTTPSSYTLFLKLVRPAVVPGIVTDNSGRPVTDNSGNTLN